MPLRPGLDRHAVGHVLCIAGPSRLFLSPHPSMRICVVVPTHQKLPPSLISRATALVVVGLCKKLISRFIPVIQIRIWEKFDIDIQYIRVQGELVCNEVWPAGGDSRSSRHLPWLGDACTAAFQAEVTMCADAVEM